MPVAIGRPHAEPGDLRQRPLATSAAPSITTSAPGDEEPDVPDTSETEIDRVAGNLVEPTP
jgi:hypothetical protein